MMNQQVVTMLALLCCITVQGLAQSPCPEKILTTNPAASVNAEKPTMKNYDKISTTNQGAEK